MTRKLFLITIVVSLKALRYLVASKLISARRFLSAGRSENIQDPVQGFRRARATGRFLPKPGRLVVTECSQCRPRVLCLSLERLY